MRSGISDADRGELLRVQAADKPHCGRKLSGLELGELDIQVADKQVRVRRHISPVNLTHTRPTVLCIHLVVIHGISAWVRT